MLVVLQMLLGFLTIYMPNYKNKKYKKISWNKKEE